MNRPGLPPVARRVLPRPRGAGASRQGVQTVEELDFDPDRFIILGPVWLITSRKAIDNQDEKGFTIAEGVTPQGVRYVEAFTDSDLAQRFIERMNDPDAVAFPVPTPPDFIQFLENLFGFGYAHIAIDHEPGRRPRIATIPALIGVVRESLKRQDEA